MSQRRVIIENLHPEINGGEFYIKRIVGESVRIEVDLYGDGHDVVNGKLSYRHASQRKWRHIPLRPLVNDRWEGEFTVEKEGMYRFQISGWVDHALNWQHELERKVEGGQHVSVELLDGVQYLDHLQKKLKGEEKKAVKEWKKVFADEEKYEEAVKYAISEELHDHFAAFPQERYAIKYPEREVWVDRKKAGFSAWYELFPRSASEVEGQHGTFRDVERLLPRIAEFGFDVLYLPPIHPIGRDFRKGKNNTTTAEPGDPGSCWGIGAEEGGHTAIHPELGTLADFKHLIKEAGKHDIELAMDIAFQCAPDHPWVKEHPQWFKWRPDGTVQYAENPPKKYQDILPIYFETDDWKNLWEALTEVVKYWMKAGVRIFRIDNPHTKPYRFWEYLIAECKKVDSGVLFLSEAFTRPKVMHMLAKVGFSQSYTYFTWRNSKYELEEYMRELTEGPGREYFRPNFWPNTPDINPWNLQGGNEATFLARYFLAATLNSNYGMYGPVYEYLVHEAVPGKEEYKDSEKYEVHHWDWDKRNKLTHVMTKVNQIRKENAALQSLLNFQLCHIENDHLIAYFKQDPATGNALLMVVNLDPYYTQTGWVQVPLDKLGISEGTRYLAHDLITGNSYPWEKEWNYIELNPNALPFHLFRLETN